jgi:hypothetical protein
VSAGLMNQISGAACTIPVPQPRSLGTLSKVEWQEVSPALGGLLSCFSSEVVSRSRPALWQDSDCCHTLPGLLDNVVGLSVGSSHNLRSHANDEAGQETRKERASFS